MTFDLSDWQRFLWRCCCCSSCLINSVGNNDLLTQPTPGDLGRVSVTPSWKHKTHWSTGRPTTASPSGSRVLRHLHETLTDISSVSSWKFNHRGEDGDLVTALSLQESGLQVQIQHKDCFYRLLLLLNTKINSRTLDPVFSTEVAASLLELNQSKRSVLWWSGLGSNISPS